MKMIVVPGYKALFGKSGKTYEEWLADIPSEVVIILIIALNTELNTPESEKEKQQRLRNIVSERYTREQLSVLNEAFGQYIIKNKGYEVSIFGHRYLVAMLLKEFQRNQGGNNLSTNPDQEFRILMAYLHVIDEVNDADQKSWTSLLNTNDVLSEYKPLWTTFIDQYEFNHQVDTIFEFVKLLCYSKYCYDNLRPFLKEYLNKYGFPNLSQFLASYKQIAETTLNYRPNQLIRKLGFIEPIQNVDIAHLKAQCVNHLLGNKDLVLSHLRKYPLYENISKEFMVIDEDMYRKKLYRGPFFEIYHETSLNSTKTFNKHCQDISKGAMEEICFRAICTLLKKSKHDVLHFDDNSQSLPDAYSRSNKKVVMVEYKDNIFKEALITKADFEAIKNDIHEKFVQSEKGKSKGITQLANQIDSLSKKQFKFDPVLNQMLIAGNTITIYPVLCYTDFMFSIPGVNKYLDELFQIQLSKMQLPNLVIKPVTMVNIEKLYDYCFRQGNFLSFTELIDRYCKILDNRKSKFAKVPTVNHYLQTKSGFDEIYQSIFQKELLNKKAETGTIKRLTDLIGLTQEEINQNL